MEIRARYFLVGLFVLAVAAAVVAFVFWLYNTGGLTKRTDYRVSFAGSVSGLAPGSPVLFNGLQVGEVTRLSLSADNPNLVFAYISIDERTPVRTDTHVGMDFRGLTGSATVALNGGSPSAAQPTSDDGQPPLLVADPKAIKDMSASAREALTKLNDILADNAEPLKDAIANIDTFSGALAKNSDKVDSILAGLEKFVVGGDKKEPVSFELTAPTEFPGDTAQPTGQLTIATPTTIVALDTQRIIAENADGLQPVFDNFRFGDSIPLLVQSRLTQGFENAGDPRVGTDASGINGDFQLLVNIRKFQVATSGEATAEVGLMAKLVDAGGSVIDAKLFEATAPVSDVDTPDVMAKGLDAAFGKASTDLIVWALTAMSDSEGGGDMGQPGDGGNGDQNGAPAPSMQTPEPPADTAPPGNMAPAPADGTQPPADAGQPPADAAQPPADAAPADKAPATAQ